MRTVVVALCLTTLVGCSELTDSPPESVPLSALTKAYCTNGEIGYVRNSDLDGETPNSPAEAVKQMETLPAKIIIACYAQDGVSRIGEFEVSNPGGEGIVDRTP